MTENGFVNTIGFDLLGQQLGHDVDSALKSALAGGAVFPGGNDPLSIFRYTLKASIRDIEMNERGRLFQRFLRDGPYERQGAIPRELRGKRLTNEETAEAITFIYSFMVNSFKGAITELLAAAACQRLVTQLRRDGDLPPTARLFVGDAVMVHRKSGSGVLKGADLHILVKDQRDSTGAGVTVAGVVEVKSGRKSADVMNRQLDQHIRRVQQGLCVSGMHYCGEKVRLGYEPEGRILRITVLPSDWKLPRTIRFENTGQCRHLHVDPTVSPCEDDEITNPVINRWHIILKWSKEALAQAAFEMTFWYMEKVGEVIYSDAKAIPKDWSEMSPAEAGCNAAKMMLYYAIPRCRSARENQRAIALYNSYGFGYALGMNFRNKDRRREMLWPKDLDELIAKGQTDQGCRIR